MRDIPQQIRRRYCLMANDRAESVGKRLGMPAYTDERPKSDVIQASYNAVVDLMVDYLHYLETAETATSFDLTELAEIAEAVYLHESSTGSALAPARRKVIDSLAHEPNDQLG